KRPPPIGVGSDLADLALLGAGGNGLGSGADGERDAVRGRQGGDERAADEAGGAGDEDPAHCPRYSGAARATEALPDRRLSRKFRLAEARGRLNKRRQSREAAR